MARRPSRGTPTTRKRTPRRRRAAPRRWWPLLLVLLLASLLPLGGWLYGLDQRVSSHFEGARWAVPARVYARALELYPGVTLGADRFEAELRRLGYRQAQASGATPGYFARDGERFSVVTRSFPFWDGEEPSRALWLEFSGQRLIELRQRDTGARIALARLEPVEIAAIYPAHHEDRILLRYDEVPPLLLQTLIAVEDRNFHRHIGLDWRGVARAAFANLRAGRTVQGGSTLTQQLVKNFYLSHERTLWRKLNEAAMALLLERRYGKEAILEAYLNEVWLGQDGRRAIHGFGLASRFYFGRPLQELRGDEIALLVGILRGAAWYDPRRHPQRALERRNTVLSVMVGEGLLEADEGARLMATTLRIEPQATGGTTAWPAYIELLRRQLRDDYREEDLASTGLRIFTTLDLHAQQAAEAALQRRLPRLEAASGWAAGTLQGAVVVADPRSGEVLALVGGREPRRAGFNRALDASRPIGSLVKPLVYLDALEHRRHHLASPLEDRAVQLRLEDGSVWAPRNFDGREQGTILFWQALARSRNLATVRLGLEAGSVAPTRLLRRFGVETRAAENPAQLLGAASLSPFEVAGFYQVLANAGMRVPLRAIREVTGADGAPLQRYGMQVEQIVSAEAVFLLEEALVRAVSDGTGRALNARLPATTRVAGKTGTSNEGRDGWFAGYDAEHLAVVWVGADDNRALGLGGAGAALPVWGDLLLELGVQGLQRSPPAGVVWYWTTPRGELRDGPCDGAERIPYMEGTQPREWQRCR